MNIDSLIILLVGAMLGSNLTIVILAFWGQNHNEDMLD